MSIPHYSREICDALLPRVAVLGYLAACRELGVSSTSVRRWRKAGAKLAESLPDAFLAKWAGAMSAAMDEWAKAQNSRQARAAHSDVVNKRRTHCPKCGCVVVDGQCVGCEAKRALAAAGREVRFTTAGR